MSDWNKGKLFRAYQKLLRPGVDCVFYGQWVFIELFVCLRSSIRKF